MTLNRKKILKTICIVMCFFCITFTANSAPYSDADIELLGNSASDRQGGRWRDTENEGIYSPWASWAEYAVELDAGNWNIGINVINHGYIAGYTHWYDNFRVEDQFGNILNITASDSEVYSGFFNYDIATFDQYIFRFKWLNDKWGGRNDPQHRDANIQISSVFFDNTATPFPGEFSVSEPTTIILIVVGMAGIVATARNKQGRQKSQKMMRYKFGRQLP